MSNAVATFIATIGSVFPKPKFNDELQEKVWHTAMIGTLMHYDDEIVKAACNEILTTRGLKPGEKWFPLPAEVNQVCVKVAERKRLEQPRMAIGVDSSPELAGTPDRLKLADELIQGELGQRAAVEGWILPLREFCSRHARLPREAEIYPLQRVAREFERSMDALDRMIDGADRKGIEVVKVAGALRNLGRTFANRTETLRGKALGKGAA